MVSQQCYCIKTHTGIVSSMFVRCATNRCLETGTDIHVFRQHYQMTKCQNTTCKIKFRYDYKNANAVKKVNKFSFIRNKYGISYREKRMNFSSVNNTLETLLSCLLYTSRCV